MRSLFNVGAKLLGLYYAFQGLLSLLSLITFLISPSPDFPPFGRPMVVVTLIPFVILLGIAYFLIFSTDFLADIVRLEKDESNQQSVSFQNSLRTGIVLIGFYVLATNIGSLISAIYRQLSLRNIGQDIAGTLPQHLNFTKDILDPAITIAIALFMIFGSELLSKLVTKAKSQ